jgi:hypothetical protein
VILLVLSKNGSPQGLPFFVPELFPFAHHKSPVGAGLLAKAPYQSVFVFLTHRFREQARSHSCQGVFSKVEEAAEKRHPAENRCRFSGIAALPWPAKPRFSDFFELAWGLLS